MRPNCMTYECPSALQARTFVFRMLPNCFTAAIFFKKSTFFDACEIMSSQT